MFKKLFSSISRFFSSLFGGKTKKPEPVPTHDPTSEEKLLEDSSDVPADTIITVDVMDVDLPMVRPDAGPFADKDKEDAFDESEEEEPTPVDDSDPVTDGGDTPGDDETDPAPPPPAHKPRYLWCLDNGHGKLQAGKRSPLFDDGETQFFEYEFNRDIVERIIKALDKIGVKYADLVPDYLDVGSFLTERVERANKQVSELPRLFVSVHSNAGPAEVGKWIANSIKGVETWHAHNSSKGKKMAAVFQRHLLEYTGLKDRGLKTTQEKNLYVLVKTVMPAILTENGFYNNKEEVKELMKPAFRQKIADAHVAAILEIEKNGLG